MFESIRLWLSNRAFDLYMWLCPEVHNPFALQESDLAHNPPSPPKLQDLDVWTEDEMRDWILDRVDRQFVTTPDEDMDDDEIEW